VWKVLECDRLTAADWGEFLCGFPAWRVPSWLLVDPRMPVGVIMERLVTGDLWDQSAVDVVTRRRDVLERVPDGVWRRWLFLGCAPVVLRALDGLSVVTRDDVAQVLRRRDSATVLVGYLVAHWRDVPEEQWELLLMDWRSSWGVVRDARTPEGVLRRYVGSSYPDVLAGVAAQERLPEQVRVMAALGADVPAS